MLERYIAQYIAAQPGDRVDFAWQGGEPTLLGVDFFRRVVELQAKYADGKSIQNALQTNGTLIDDKWGEFLAEIIFWWAFPSMARASCTTFTAWTRADADIRPRDARHFKAQAQRSISIP